MRLNRKFLEALGAVVLVCFSFYYTDQAVDIVRRNDPVMKEIEKISNSYLINAIDARLIDNSLIPGYSGKKVNVKESYYKMKQYGSYEESLLVFEEVEPTISMDEYYDKYVIRGNDLKNSVSLVFKVEKNDNILNILNEKNIQATFFIDGVFLENNSELVYDMLSEEHEVEVLSYDDTLDRKTFKTSLENLESISNIKGKYCYAEYDQKELLELCSKEEMHTVIPTILASNRPFTTVKKKIDNGNIIAFPINNEVIKELATIINYIKQKGYNIERLDNLLSEKESKK